MTDRTYKHLTYRIVAVDLAGALGAARRFNEAAHTAHRQLRSALGYVSRMACQGDRFRIVAIPPGESWDYDGPIVATVDLRSGQ